MATKTKTLTLDELIAKHAADIAYAADTNPSTTARTFTHQLNTAAANLNFAGINGHEDLETAAIYLNDAVQAQGAEQAVLLTKAARYLAEVPDMVDEYRDAS